MKKIRFAFFALLFCVSFFFKGNSLIASDVKNDSYTKTQCLLNDIYNKLKVIKKSIVNIGDIDSKNSDIDENKKLLEKSYTEWEGFRENKILLGLYKSCKELINDIQKKSAEIRDKEKKNGLLTKFKKDFNDLKKMSIRGEDFCKNENKDSLESIKTEAKTIETTTSSEFTTNKDFIDTIPELKDVKDSITKTAKSISNMKVAESTNIWNFNLIWQGAIVLASLFLIGNMIFNNLKTKKMMKNINKPNNNIPTI